MTDDLKVPPRITARCVTPAEWRAEAENDEAWLVEHRKLTRYATTLRDSLAAILATIPGTVEHEQAKHRGHVLLRRIEREDA